MKPALQWMLRSLSRWRWPCVMQVLLCCLTLHALDASAAGAANSAERSVKAAFLYKFLGYVDYPAAQQPDAGAPYTVGVLDADDIAAELVRLTAGHNINNHAVQVRVLHGGDALNGMQLLFIGNGAGEPARLIRAAQALGILVVSESDNGLQQGSVINFRLVDERIRFEISLEAADKCNLKLSSRLLAVAYHVQKEGP